jgi:hypothetical protein
MIQKTIFIIFAILISSCSSTKLIHEDIVIGKYYGQCRIDCSRMYHVQKGRVFVDRTDSFFDNRTNYTYFDNNKGDEVVKIDWKVFAELINKLPKNLNDYDDELGCPDCFDQGGILIKIKNKEIRLDPSSHPDEFKEFVSLLRKLPTDL